MKLALAVAVAVLCAAIIAPIAATVEPAPAAAAHGKLTRDERRWVAAALAFTHDVQDRVELSSAGGSDLASTRRALHDTSNLYATLVAYTYFGSCSNILHNIGTPSPRLTPAVRTLAGACHGFEHASALYELAVRQDDPRALVAASHASLAALAPVVAARGWLERLGQ